MYRILHCADLHLDTPFAEDGFGPEVGVLRRADLRATLARIGSLAREQGVDAVTIAGDLYQQTTVVPETLALILDQFARLAPIRVLIAPGRSDPYTHDSLYQRMRWPSNVLIFAQDALHPVELAPNIYVWGVACPPGRGYSSIVIPRPVNDATNLLLLHAAETRPNTPLSNDLFSFDTAAVHASGFAGALLGHLHPGRIWPAGDTLCVYPGSPELLRAGEAAGLHGVALLEIDGTRCKARSIPTSRWRYLQFDVDLADCVAEQAVVQRVKHLLETTPEAHDDRVLCTVQLCGSTRWTVDFMRLREQLSVQAHVRFIARSFEPVEDVALRSERTVLGLVVQRLRDRIQTVSDEHVRQTTVAALRYVVQALSGERVRP